METGDGADGALASAAGAGVAAGAGAEVVLAGHDASVAGAGLGAAAGVASPGAEAVVAAAGAVSFSRSVNMMSHPTARGCSVAKSRRKSPWICRLNGQRPIKSNDF